MSLDAPSASVEAFKDPAVAFSVVLNMRGTSVTVKYTGTLAGDTITGSTETPGRDGGEPMKRDWTATRGAAADAAAPAPAP